MTKRRNATRQNGAKTDPDFAILDIYHNALATEIRHSFSLHGLFPHNGV